MEENLVQPQEAVAPLENITSTLETMKVNSLISIPNYQRATINSTIQRLKDRSSRRFSIKRINDIYFTLRRIR